MPFETVKSVPNWNFWCCDHIAKRSSVASPADRMDHDEMGLTSSIFFEKASIQWGPLAIIVPSLIGL